MGNLCGSENATNPATEGAANTGLESGHVDINLAEFLSVLVFLSEECGKIIR